MLHARLDMILEDIKKSGEEEPHIEKAIDLTEDQKCQIKKEIESELKAIRKEREDAGLPDIWKKKKRQHDGCLYEGKNDDDMMKISSCLTKDKVSKLVNRAYRAITSTDPIYVVSARPDFADETPNSQEVARDQSDFLDYALDERVPFKAILKRVLRSSAIYEVGWMAWDVCIQKRSVNKTVKINGSPEWTISMKLKEEGDQTLTVTSMDELESVTKQLEKEKTEYSVAYRNEELESYIMEYKDSAKESHIKALYEGKEIEFEATYEEIVKECPVPRFVEIENLFIRLNVDGYEECASTKMIAEKKEYNYFQMKQLEKKGYMFAIDELIYANEDDKKADKKKEGYDEEQYDVMQCTLITEIEGEEVKLLVWYNEDKKIIIGAQRYDDQYENVPCQYVPHYIKQVKNGIYQEGLSEDLVNEDLTITMLLRFMLEGWYQNNIVTPITEDQDIINDFISRKWVHGMPLSAKPGSVRFLNEFQRPIDLGGGLELVAQTKRIAEDKTGLSSGMSGGADPIDPNAPATKTLALLSESKPDLIAYIENLAPAINQSGYIILAIFAQLADEPLPYRVKPERVTKGDSNVFKKISKENLKAKTNIQTQAIAYAVDELQMKRELVAFYSLIRQEPLFANNPEAVLATLRAIGKAWNSQIRNHIDDILPPIEKAREMMVGAAAQGVMKYVEAEIAKATATGQEIKFNPEMLLETVNKMVKQVTTPLNKQEIAEEEGYYERIARQD